MMLRDGYYPDEWCWTISPTHLQRMTSPGTTYSAKTQQIYSNLRNDHFSVHAFYYSCKTLSKSKRCSHIQSPALSNMFQRFSCIGLHTVPSEAKQVQHKCSDHEDQHSRHKHDHQSSDRNDGADFVNIKKHFAEWY